MTIGELCLSPIGLSLVGKLAPKRFTSLLYGVFFLSNASGYALAGTLGAIFLLPEINLRPPVKWALILQAVLDKTITPTPEQLKMLADKNIMDHYPVFAGFQITNLYEFFWYFVILTGSCFGIAFCVGANT
jgi:POT family proton-dependent oligopeptide transporter